MNIIYTLYNMNPSPGKANGCPAAVMWKAQCAWGVVFSTYSHQAHCEGLHSHNVVSAWLRGDTAVNLSIEQCRPPLLYVIVVCELSPTFRAFPPGLFRCKKLISFIYRPVTILQKLRKFLQDYLNKMSDILISIQIKDGMNFPKPTKRGVANPRFVDCLEN